MGDDAVFVAQTGCLYPCNSGPVMLVCSEALWRGGLTEKGVKRIVEEHFEGGQVVSRYARYPSQQTEQRPTEVQHVKIMLEPLDSSECVLISGQNQR